MGRGCSRSWTSVNVVENETIGHEVMKFHTRALFTHGGFYNHFPSKEALAAEAALAGLQRSNATLTETLMDQSGSDPPPLWPVIPAVPSSPHTRNMPAAMTTA